MPIVKSAVAIGLHRTKGSDRFMTRLAPPGAESREFAPPALGSCATDQHWLSPDR